MDEPAALEAVDGNAGLRQSKGQSNEREQMNKTTNAQRQKNNNNKTPFKTVNKQLGELVELSVKTAWSSYQNVVTQHRCLQIKTHNFGFGQTAMTTEVVLLSSIHLQEGKPHTNYNNNNNDTIKPSKSALVEPPTSTSNDNSNFPV